MIPFPMTHPMTAKEIVAATHALLQVARVDAACTREEIDLIRTFYQSNGADEALPAFDALLAQPPAGADALAIADSEHRDFVVALCVMVAYADGQLTDGEIRSVRNVGKALGVPAARIDDVMAQVKDHLLSQLSGLPDSGSVAKVAQELG